MKIHKEIKEKEGYGENWDIERKEVAHEIEGGKKAWENKISLKRRIFISLSVNENYRDYGGEIKRLLELTSLWYSLIGVL